MTETPGEPPLVGAGRLEAARTVGTGVFVVTGLLLLAWPVAAFVGIFVFDAPIRGAADALLRYSMVGAIWGYPAFWGVGLGLFRRALKDLRPGPAVWLPMLLPLLPILWLALVFAFGG